MVESCELPRFDDIARGVRWVAGTVAIRCFVELQKFGLRAAVFHFFAEVPVV